MAAIPNLWPTTEITLDVLTPIAILRAQASQLQQFTKGLLEAEVETASSATQTQLHFDIVAPALHRYRQRILTIQHANEDVYPVYIHDISSFHNNQSETLMASALGNDGEVYTDKQFMDALKDIFNSKKVKATLSSLIARSNEEKDPFENE